MTLRSNSDGVGAEALQLTSTAGDIDFAPTSIIAGGTDGGGSDVTITAAAGTVTVGQALAVGKTLTIGARDVELSAVASASHSIRAANVRLNNLAAATDPNPTLLGSEASAASGFRLSEAELNRIEAADVRLSSGSTGAGDQQAVRIGNLSLGSHVGSTSFAIYGVGTTIDVTGRFEAMGGGASRRIQLGGAGAPGANAQATTIRITYGGSSATSGGIDVDTSTLELRAGKIVAGRSSFIDAVAQSSNIPQDFIANPTSLLYNAGARLGGDIYPSGAKLINAGSLVVRFSDYALFQNTGLPGANSGITLTGPAGGAGTQPLQIYSYGIGAPNGFAMFGSIGTSTTGDFGIPSAATAVLGPTFIGLSDANPSNARINGCLIGSASGGCLLTAVGTTAFLLSEATRQQVIQAADEMLLTLDLAIGSNNEALLGLEPNLCPDGSTAEQCKKDAQ